MSIKKCESAMSGITLRDNRNIMPFEIAWVDPTPSVSIAPSVTPSAEAYKEMTIKTRLGSISVKTTDAYDINVHTTLYYNHRNYPSAMNSDALRAYESEHGKSSYHLIKSFNDFAELQKYDREHGTINTVKSETITFLHYLLEKYTLFQIEQILRVDSIRFFLTGRHTKSEWEYIINLNWDLDTILQPKPFSEYKEEEFVKPIIA